MIRKKREERMEREKMIRLEQEEKRQELLEKKWFRLPKIIVTQYFDAFDESRAQSAKKEASSVLPNLVNIPCGSDSERGREDSDAESQGSKGDRLELPELERNIPEGYFEDIEQADEQQNESLSPENENQVEAVADVNDSNSQEIDLGANTENVVLEDESGKVLGDDISQSEIAIEPESDPVSEEVNMKIDDQNVQQIERKTSENSSHEQCNATNENGEGELEEKKSESERRTEEKESERKVEEKESSTKVEEEETNGIVEEKDCENEEEKNEIQMNFLAPPSVPVMAGENGSDHGSIGDADETGNAASGLTNKFCFMRYTL